MAERVENFDFKRRGPTGTSRYDQYLDGGIYRLVLGKDIPVHGRSQLAHLASKRGKKVRTHTEDGVLVVQAYAP